MKSQILGVNFDNLTPEQAKDRFLGLLESEAPSLVVTPNPEMVMLAQRDANFMELLNSADLCVPDGIGVVWASKFTQSVIEQRVPGIDLILAVFKSRRGRQARYFFLGGAPGVADDAKDAMEAQFPGLRVIDTHHGYFHDDFENEVVERIAAAKPDIVLVGLGFPRQERWIAANKGRLGAKVLMGVGGSFDVMSGNLRRAPAVFQKMGLEWLYRLLRQPSRIWRQRVLLKFVFKVLFERMRGK
ncbi:MAG: WecB/TagA/CpsF family glycosyltransferase [Clostridiales bacterium]|jgi:N-acetylglucosaminyldiphosphoundecaprenol N-acetyl-beta-D-mannosaminyltransferase|nr:WecB/TagA/CpsF family glycosyltransferase [Clostridiales bacterium]